ncbi:MAG: LPS assembly lipoprotein LptE [Holophagales bacterium]|jgi:hypothetical protein|nr:LPS assembly lipoprotein LptE [Holophagales bacterium]
MRQTFFALFLCCLAGCGYHRLDRAENTVPWIVRGETIRLDKIYNNTKRGGLEDIFRKAIESRIITSSPWKLNVGEAESRWILKVTIEFYEVRMLGLNLNSMQGGSASTSNRIEIFILVGLQILDGKTGTLVVDIPKLTFRNHYMIDQNLAASENKEVQIINRLADDFAESFLTQLLVRHD